MPPRGRVAAVTCLLTWLCVARCGGDASGGVSSPSPPPEAAAVSLADTLELLWEAVSRTVSTAAGSSCSGVQTRLESGQSRLEAQLESRLGTVQTQLDTRLGTAQTQLESRLDSVKTHMESRLDSLQTRLESELSSVHSDLRLALPPTRDCSDLPAGAASGVHLLQPGLRQPVPTLCDQDTDGGGWTVFQRRADIQPRRSFYLGWQAYKWGFGELDAEFWWGLKNLFEMTSLLDRRYQLRIDMEDFDGEKRYALYQDFRISSEADGYRLSVANYSGNAGDSFGGLSGIRFSTKDNDQDTYSGNCATMYKGGWWYTKCHSSNLNGLYLSGSHKSYADGINWHAWRGHHYSLKTVEMKIKPSKKL